MRDKLTRRSFLKIVSAATIAAGAPPLMTTCALASPSDLAVQAATKALAGDFVAAGSLAKQSGSTAAIKFVELFYLRDHGPEAGYQRVMAFLDAAPGWPLHDTLLKRAEQALYDNAEKPDVILAHFNGRKPLTPFGALALARAAFATGDKQNGKIWLRDAWGNPELDGALEQKVLAEFATSLSAEDHAYRLWRLIYAQSSAAALRQARSHLGGDYQAAAKAAQSLIAFQGGAEKQYTLLPASMRNELAMRYVLVRYLRKTEAFDRARAMLLSVPADAVAMGNAEAWYEERRTIVRRSVGPLQRGSWQAGYEIAARHGLQSGDLAIDGEFLAGWVALRYLNRPQKALPHFLKIQNLAQNATDHARALYWIGRTQKALGSMVQARAAFAAAGHHSTLYYGQLAREELGIGKRAADIAAPGASDAAKVRVEQDELVGAFKLLAEAGNKNQLNVFLLPLASRFQNTDELNAVAALVQQAGGTSWALRFAKAASLKGHELDAWAYPLYGLPTWAQLGKPIEKPFVFALSRQESEFDPQAGSSVGAQGLMQLMPGTARLVAKQYRIGYSAARLKEAGYNVQLGAAHLADLVDGLNGSYILTLVAYNAGPRRAQDWLAYYGDPRGGQVDPVDWVECIPFNETRQYVQKVLQNLHIYRSRLAPDTVRPMTADLKRGTPENLAVASTSPATATK